MADVLHCASFALFNRGLAGKVFDEVQQGR